MARRNDASATRDRAKEKEINAEAKALMESAVKYMERAMEIADTQDNLGLAKQNLKTCYNALGSINYSMGNEAEYEKWAAKARELNK